MVVLHSNFKFQPILGEISLFSAAVQAGRVFAIALPSSDATSQRE